jgi:hypothetical protein
MSAATVLRALLAADAGVTTIAAQRISRDLAGQGTARPMVVFGVAATEIERGLNGVVHGRRTEFALQCVADTRAQADALADAVQAALDGAHQYVTARDDVYDGALDIFVSALTASWWE